MFRSKNDNDLVDAMHTLIYELEEAIKRQEHLNNEIVLALNRLKIAVDTSEKEIDAIIKNLLHQSENSGRFDS